MKVSRIERNTVPQFPHKGQASYHRLTFDLELLNVRVSLISCVYCIKILSKVSILVNCFVFFLF